MNKISMDEALATLGLSHVVLECEYRKIPPGPNRWEEMARVYKETVKKAHKQTVLTLHPDRCKDADATEKCAKVNWVATELLKLHPSPPPQPLQMPVVFFHHFGNTTSNTTTSVFNAGMSFTIKFG